MKRIKFEVGKFYLSMSGSTFKYVGTDGELNYFEFFGEGNGGWAKHYGGKFDGYIDFEIEHSESTFTLIN